MGETKKLIKCNARKKNYKNKNNKNLVSNKKTKINKNIQKGGKHEYFEVKAWDDIDFNKISLTRNADIDWGGSAFGQMIPPTDCCIC
jgi:hypothetical protein